MKKFLSIIILCLCVSCSKDSIDIHNNSNSYKLEKRTFWGEMDSTRAFLEMNKVYWEIGDKIGVIDNISKELQSFTVVEIKDNQVRIEGEIPQGATDFAAVYPDVAYNSVDFINRDVNVSIPQNQIISNHSIDSNAIVCVAFYENECFHFKNAVSLLKFRMPLDDIKRVTLRDYNRLTKCSGNTCVHLSSNISTECTGESSVELINEAGFIKGEIYYLALAPAKFANGLQIIYANNLGLGVLNSTSEFLFQRNSGIDIGSVSPVWTYLENPISSASEFKDWIENKASSMTKDDVVVLSADIDLQSESVNPVSSFAGTFDGQGFAIKNADLSKGVFANVTETGVVKNVVIDSSCTAEADANVFGTLVTVNNGLISSCVNNANISTSTALAAGAIGGLVGQSTGLVENCVNNGNITVQTSSITGDRYYGGVVGQITLTKVASDKVLVDGCKNSGNIAVRCTTTPKNAYVGGVVGGNTTSKLSGIKLIGTIQSCVNSGNVDYGFDVLATGTYTDIGGIVGYWEGHLKDSENGGNIAYTLPIVDRSVYATCPATAGVAGVLIGNAENLINRGNVTINGVWAAGTAGNAGAGGYHQPIWGGVIAKHGTDYSAANNNVTADNLTNYGTISGTIYMRTGGATIHILGGVLGTSNGKLSHLYNNGIIDVLVGGKSNYVGGIIGHHSGLVLSDCVNTAAVTVDGSDQVLTSQVVGGIVAYELIKGGVLSNLENKGAITLKESNPAASTAYQYLAGIMGNYSGNTQTLNNCVNRGIITSNTTKKVRVAGVIAAIYDSTAVAPTTNTGKTAIETEGTPGTNPLVNCHNYGNIFVNNAGNPASSNPGSMVGGIACYCSIGMEGCSNTGNITLKGCASNTVAGLMAGTINRRYDILDCRIAGKLVSNVAFNKLGLFTGSLYTDPAIYNFGSASQPVTVAATATINGVAPELNIDGLVGGGNTYPKEQQVVIVNIKRE